MALSCAWHVLHIFFFDLCFELVSPAQAGGRGREVLAVEVLLQNDAPQVAVNSPWKLPSIDETFKAPDPPLFTKLPTAPDWPGVSRLRPGTRVGVSPLRPGTPSPPEAADAQVGTTDSSPLIFSSSLQRRKLLFAPPLPPYPEWAEREGLDLILELELEVSPQGSVVHTRTLRSCGDFETDDLARRYAEKMLFEASDSIDRGQLQWEFKLSSR